jgi:hypothetical protein
MYARSSASLLKLFVIMCRCRREGRGEGQQECSGQGAQEDGGTWHGRTTSDDHRYQRGRKQPAKKKSEAPVVNGKVRKAKRMSRPARWAAAVATAMGALEVLEEIQGEYADWRDGLPENLQNTALSEKLDAVCDLDIEGAESIINEAEDIELPLGFGRDE